MQRQHITRALFVETGTYNDMTSRPYQTSFDTPVLQQFQEATQGGQFLAASNIAGVAGNFIRPMGEPERDGNGNAKIVGISNGWGNSRLRFMLDISTPSNFGTLRQIVTGYTDHVGASRVNGAFDQNMLLYFNNIITLRSVQDMTATGSQIRTTVADASHFLTGRYEPGFNGGNVTYTMRPEDVFARLSSLDIDGVMDTRTTFGAGHKKSKRSNGNASNFVSKFLRSYKSTTEDDTNSAADMTEMMDSARGMVQESNLVDDQFLMTLQRGNVTFQEGGCVRMGEMLHMFPELNHDDIAKLQFATGSMMAETHQTGQTEHWNGSTMETVATTALTHSVPSLMMEYMLTRVQFMATNRTLNGEFDVVVSGCRGFADGVDLSPYLQKFIDRMKVEVLRGLSSNNMIDFELTMMVDILGETRITIAMNGGPQIDYAVPSFCDALFVPVVTDNSTTLDTLAYDMGQLADTIGVQHYNQVAANPHQSYGATNVAHGNHSSI